MSTKQNLLQKSSYIPQRIILCSDKDQESEIDSDESGSPNHNPSSKNTTHHSHHHSIPQCPSKHSSIPQQKNIVQQQVKKPFNNLLQPPSKDYVEKYQIYLEKRIQEQAIVNYEKESFFGKRKDKVIEISDVSSESESLKEVSKKPSKQRKLNEWEEEDELLQKYSIGGIKKNAKKNEINLEESKEDNPFAHLHPEYEEEKKGPISDEESDKISQVNSDDSLIIIRPKYKHTHRRLRKMANVSNRVKIENKENDKQTQECPICLTDLNKKEERKKGKLACNHIFCLKCITEASKFSNRCPYCRAAFNEIRCNGRRIQVEDTRLNEEFEDPNDQPCYICGRNNDFERLLECEFCEYAYCHTYCDPRLNNRELGAEEAWYCASCEELMRHRLENGQDEEGGEDEQEDVESVVEEVIEPQNRRNQERHLSDGEYEASQEQDF